MGVNLRVVTLFVSRILLPLFFSFYPKIGGGGLTPKPLLAYTLDAVHRTLGSEDLKCGIMKYEILLICSPTK